MPHKNFCRTKLRLLIIICICFQEQHILWSIALCLLEKNLLRSLQRCTFPRIHFGHKIIRLMQMMKIFCISLIFILSKFNIIKGTSNNLDITLSNVTIDKIPIMPLFVFIFFFNMLYKYKACCRAYSCRSCVYADV